MICLMGKYLRIGGIWRLLRVFLLMVYTEQVTPLKNLGSFLNELLRLVRKRAIWFLMHSAVAEQLGLLLSD